MLLGFFYAPAAFRRVRARRSSGHPPSPPRVRAGGGWGDGAGGGPVPLHAGRGAGTPPRGAATVFVQEPAASARWCAARPPVLHQLERARALLMACCLKSGTCPVPALLSSSAAPLVPLAFDSQSTTPSGVSMCNVVRPLSPIILRDGSRSLACDTLRVSAAVDSTTSQASDADPSQVSGLCRCPSGFVFSHAIKCGLRFA